MSGKPSLSNYHKVNWVLKNVWRTHCRFISYGMSIPKAKEKRPQSLLSVESIDKLELRCLIWVPLIPLLVSFWACRPKDLITFQLPCESQADVPALYLESSLRVYWIVLVLLKHIVILEQSIWITISWALTYLLFIGITFKTVSHTNLVVHP